MNKKQDDASRTMPRPNFLLWTGLLLLVLTILHYAYTLHERGQQAPVAGASRVDIFTHPIFYAAIGSILAFLVVDRWRKIETDVADMRKAQQAEFKEIKKEADDAIKIRIEGAMRKAQAIESRLGSIMEQHPWIASITENELIPDASACRIVLITAEEFIRNGKVALAYEYLFGWAAPLGARDKKLEGTVADFMDLVDFCENTLNDEYLGILILDQAHLYAINRALFTPEYMKRLVRQGRMLDAVTVAEQLKGSINPSWSARMVNLLRGRRLNMQAAYLARSYSALALFEAVNGRLGKAGKLMSKAKINATNAATDGEVKLVEAEIYAINGDFIHAQEILDGLNSSSAGASSQIHGSDAGPIREIIRNNGFSFGHARRQSTHKKPNKSDLSENTVPKVNLEAKVPVDPVAIPVPAGMHVIIESAEPGVSASAEKDLTCR